MTLQSDGATPREYPIGRPLEAERERSLITWALAEGFCVQVAEGAPYMIFVEKIPAPTRLFDQDEECAEGLRQATSDPSEWGSGAYSSPRPAPPSDAIADHPAGSGLDETCPVCGETPCLLADLGATLWRFRGGS